MLYEIVEHRNEQGKEVSERVCFVEDLDKATLVILKFSGWACMPGVEVGGVYQQQHGTKNYTVEEFE